MPPPISRRGFLQSTAGASILGSSMISLADDGPALYDGEVVDPHLHLWDLKTLSPPWVASTTGHARDVLAHDFLLSDYAKATQGLKVTKAVYMEVDVDPADQTKEARIVSDLCARGGSPMVGAVVSGRPASEGFGAYLDQFRENRYVKGVRQVLHTPATPPKFCLEEAFVKGVRMLGDRGLSFDLCLRNDQLEIGAELIDRCPGTRFILDHCGNPQAGSLDLEGWRRGLAKIASRKDRTVVCKVSGLYANVTAAEWPADRLKPIVRAVIDEFGWDRVMFAGDWPVVNLGASFAVWLEALKRIVRSDRPSDQARLFRENALLFHGL